MFRNPSGHRWIVSHDNNRAGYWRCSVCNSEDYFMGIPSPMSGFADEVVLYVEDHWDLGMNCIELGVVGVTLS